MSHAVKLTSLTLVVFLAIGTVALAALIGSGSGFGIARAVSDLRAPSIESATIAREGSSSGGYLRQGQTYAVYANATDLGSPASGINSITVDVSQISAGVTSTALQACVLTCIVGGTSYSYKSSDLTADADLAEGARTFSITTRDNDANTDSFDFQVVVDNTAPIITATVPADQARISSTTPALSGVASNGASDGSSVTVTVYNGSSISGSVAQVLTTTRLGTSWSVTASALSEGTYTFKAQQADFAANVGDSNANTFTVDTTAPSVQLVTPASGSYMNTTTPRVTGTASIGAGDSSSVTVTVYNGPAVTGTVNQTLVGSIGSNGFAVTPTALPAGTYTFRASQSDSAGNLGLSGASIVTIDVSAPSAANISTTNGGTSTKPDTGDKVTFTFSEQMLSTSIVSGWSGATTTVTVLVEDNVASGKDRLSLPGVNLGSVNLDQNDYVTGGNVTFTVSSMYQNGASIVVTLGTPCTTAGCGTAQSNTANSARGKFAWTPSSSATDLAGNAALTTVKQGANDRYF